MIEKNICLSSVNDVKLFVNEVSKFKFQIDLLSGKYAVDAKSIMGVFSLDLACPIKMIAHTDDPNFLQKINKYKIE